PADLPEGVCECREVVDGKNTHHSRNLPRRQRKGGGARELPCDGGRLPPSDSDHVRGIIDADPATASHRQGDGVVPRAAPEVQVDTIAAHFQQSTKSLRDNWVGAAGRVISTTDGVV